MAAVRLGQRPQQEMRSGLASTGAVEAGPEDGIRRSSQPAKACCRASRTARGPDLPSGEEGQAGSRVRLHTLSHRDASLLPVLSYYHIPGNPDRSF